MHGCVRSWTGGHSEPLATSPPLSAEQRGGTNTAEPKSNPCWVSLLFDCQFRLTTHGFRMSNTSVPKLWGPGKSRLAAAREALLMACQQHLSMDSMPSSAYWALAIWFAEREFRGFSL